MKSQRSLFKWFAFLVLIALIFEFMQVLPLASAQVANTPTPTQTAATLSFASFDGSYGMDGNDVFTYGGTYNNGFIINYDLTSIDRGIWGDPDWYVHLVVRFTVSGSAAGVYIRNDAEATGSFFYTRQPNVLSVDLQQFGWDTWATGTQPNRYGLGHVVADGVDPFQNGWVDIDLAAAANSTASFRGTLYFQPQPVFSTPVPATATPTGNCSTTNLSAIAQAVSAEVGPQEYCGNHFDGLIVLPTGEQAYQRFNDLAQGAKYEIDFTTMIWDENGMGAGDSAGRIFLQGIKELYTRVQQHLTDMEYPPEGVKVRILVGLKNYPLELPMRPHAYEDQRIRIMEDMAALEVPFTGPKWNVEVAVYRLGLVHGLHSHAKLMIVDGKTVIAAGYNMQYAYMNGGTRRDMGIEVTGPIAFHALQAFDELWAEALNCVQFDEQTRQCTQSSYVTTSHNEALALPASSSGDDVVFSLFRTAVVGHKTSDNAIAAAIGAANTNVNIFQKWFVNNSFWNPPQYARAVLDVLQKNDADVHVRVLVSGGLPEDRPVNVIGLCMLKLQLLSEDPSKLPFLETRSSIKSNPVHTKALSIDNKFVIVGSQNFDPSAWGNDASDWPWGDLAEYSLGIDSTAVATTFDGTTIEGTDGTFNQEWNNAKPIICSSIINPGTLQNVIDQAQAGSTIFIPAGVYSESVTVNKPLVLVGANAHQTVIRSESSNPAIKITSSDVVITNMRISGGLGYGIELIDTSPSSLKDIQINRVIFENNALGGVLAQGQIPGSPMNYTIENSAFIGGADGIAINMIEIQADPSFIRNNIFFGQSNAPIHILSTNDSRVEYSYNLFDDCGVGACVTNWRSGNMSNSSSAHDNLFDLNPVFANAVKGAYQLSAGSPAIDAGDPNMLHELYYDGDNDGMIRIDIGAFEYVPVSNVAPAVNAGNNQAVNLGSSATVIATYFDADNPENHSARIDWGDGTIEDVPVNMTGPGAGEVNVQHTYSSIGNYIVEVCVADLYGGVGCDPATIVVSPLSCTPSNSYALSPTGGAKFVSLTAANATNFNRLPLSFVPNRGQEDQAVRYQARGLGGNLFFTPSEVVFSLPNPVKVTENDRASVRYDLHPANVVRIHYQGANENPEVVSLGQLPGVVNILKGNNPSKWRSNLPTYSGIAYRELYPGVELRYEGTDGQLKSTFHVAPGADPSAIVWSYKGTDSLSTDQSGNLVIKLPEPAGAGAALVEQAPIAWQEVAGNRVMVAVQYAVSNNDKKVSFAFPNGYDSSLPLIIDPTITYSTYLGGVRTDEGHAITLDADCNVYIAGDTSSSNFPTVNPFQQNPPTKDIFVSKFNPAGDTLLYSTYIGGNQSDQAWGVALDSQGRITVVGESESSDFPMQNAYNSTFAGGTCADGEPCDDVIVTQLNPGGATLRYSTYLGGTQEDNGYALAIGPGDKIHLTGATRSSGFPAKNAFDSSFGAGTCSGTPCYDAFVSTIDPSLTGSASLLYSTFLGNNDYDDGMGIAVDSAGHVYVTGYTRSDGFPSRSAYRATRVGSTDAFIAKFNTALSGDASLLYSSYFGGTGDDRAFGIALNGVNQVYLTGVTKSTNFPLATPFDDSFGGGTCGTQVCGDVFVTHLNIGNNSLVYSSYLGGGHHEEGAGITVDDNSNAYVTGFTRSTNFNTLSPIQANKAADSCSSTPCSDAFLTNVSPTGALVYSTYLGGTAEDYGMAVVLDGLGNTYLTGYTFSSNFPDAVNQFVGESGYADAFIVKIND